MSITLYSVAIEIGPPGIVSVNESVRTVLSAREVPGDPELLLSLKGYDDDPREIWEIPEARDYVRQVFTTVAAVDGRWWAEANKHEHTVLWLGLTLGVARKVPGGIQFMRPGQSSWDD